MKACESCSQEAVAGERFCTLHRWKLRREMERTGYLQQVEPRPYITPDMTDPAPLPGSDQALDALFEELEEK